MSTDTRTSLSACLNAYCGGTKRKPSTVAQAAAGDWRFFDKIDGGNFTLRKYDDVMSWFSENWPDDLPWPEGVTRPAAAEEAETGAAA